MSEPTIWGAEPLYITTSKEERINLRIISTTCFCFGSLGIHKDCENSEHPTIILFGMECIQPIYPRTPLRNYTQFQ